MLHPARSYEELRQAFRWRIPQRYNIGFDAVDKHVAAGHGDRTALIHAAEGGELVRHSFRDIAQASNRFANLLLAQGLRRGERVGILLAQRPETAIAHVAVYKAGMIAVPLFTLFGPDALEYRLADSGARALITDTGNLEKIAGIRPRLPQLASLIVIDGGAGEAGPATDLRQAIAAASDRFTAADTAAEDPAVLIYTSGTTGPPKGVMISQANVAWTAESLKRTFGDEIDLSGYRVVSYLPMAHIAERMTSHYMGVGNGYVISCCPDAGQIGAYLRDVRPNSMFGVPRVWEKLAAGVQAALASDPEKKAQLDQAVAAGVPIALDRSWGRSTPEQDATWDFLQYAGLRDVRALIGLDQVEFAITGAAPIARELLEWFNGLGVPLSEIYGMSENTGPMTWTPRRIKPGTVGPACAGVEVALADDGEVICRGGNVFLGYLNDPEKTAEALDADGWLHTGDIGVLDDDGYLKIVDRKKELIITAGGKNISPANLEAALKTVPLIGQACAIGDQRPFVAALVVLDPEVAA
ncbi:MAG TPA: AMP-binding protein, partial [Dongiaceae bacterium]|nr:AMP-binding protein [Dongiaceae bacterium]